MSRTLITTLALMLLAGCAGGGSMPAAPSAASAPSGLGSGSVPAGGSSASGAGTSK